MADNDARPGERINPSVNDIPHAAFLFFEEASVAGHLNGIINISHWLPTVTTSDPMGISSAIMSSPPICAALFERPRTCITRSALRCWRRPQRRIA